jgi:hypothetical protein
MTDVDEATEDDAESRATFAFTASIAVAVVVGAALGITARLSALDLLIAVAAVQAATAFAVTYGFGLPGRKGTVVLAALAAAGADLVVSVWPHSRLGTLLAVLGLAIPLLIVHQLMRGAARLRVLESLGGAAILIVAVIALPALVQLRHEFLSSTTAGRVVFGVVLSMTAALVVGFLTDLVVAAPRFDPAVPRGLVAVVASALAGALVGYLTLRDTHDFAGGRGLFAGGSLGVLVALVAVGVAFAEATTPAPQSGFARRIRGGLAVLLPICVLAPVAFLLCLAIRA